MTPSPGPRQRGRPPHGMRRLLPVVALVMVCVPGAFLPMPGTSLVEAGQPTAQPSRQAELQSLAGRWVRLEGGYVLALGEVTKEGSVKAAYFNPRPINVSRAEVRRVAGALTLVVELRDVNYPGSTYTLQYDPASDRLKGTYFQAVEKQAYVIEFVRAK
jgi:hypothetical protein